MRTLTDRLRADGIDAFINLWVQVLVRSQFIRWSILSVSMQRNILSMHLNLDSGLLSPTYASGQGATCCERTGDQYAMRRRRHLAQSGNATSYGSAGQLPKRLGRGLSVRHWVNPAKGFRRGR